MSVKVKIFKKSKRRQTNVYVDEIIFLKKSQEKNVRIIHKSFSKKSYVFESIRKQDILIELYLTEVNALLTDETTIVFMINFEIISAKMIKRQLLERLIHSSRSLQSASINFDYENVFMKKHTIVNFVKIDKEKNSFVINSKKENSKTKIDINDH